MRSVFLSLLVLFTCGCGSQLKDSSSLPTKQSLVNDVRKKTILQLKVEKELYACGVGSRMMDQIKALALSFNYYKEVDIEEARELLLSAGMVFLDNINSNGQIRSHLSNYPFRPENIQIRIFIKNRSGSLTERDKLAVAAMVDGILEYDISSSETQCLKTIYRETYEEAVLKANHLVFLTSH